MAAERGLVVFTTVWDSNVRFPFVPSASFLYSIILAMDLSPSCRSLVTGESGRGKLLCNMSRLDAAPQW